MRNLGQGAQLEWLVKVLIDVLDDPVHSLRVFAVTIARDHGKAKVFV